MSRVRVQRQTYAQQAAAALREEIYSGQLAADARINIDEAAERFGMSQIPVREALRALEAEGLVSFLSQRGYNVNAATPEDFMDTYRLRLVLDPMATEMSVPNLGPADLDRAQEAFDRYMAAVRAGNWEEHRLFHREFHFAIYSRCGSPWLLRILEMLWGNSERYQRMSAEPRGNSEDRGREHRAILAAAVTGDAAQAAEAVRLHISRTKSTLDEMFSGDNPDLNHTPDHSWHSQNAEHISGNGRDASGSDGAELPASKSPR